MARDRGGFRTAYSKIAKWSRFLVPCIPKRNNGTEMERMTRKMRQIAKELSPETAEKLHTVLGNDLRDMLTHMRNVIVHRTANHEDGFYNEPTGTIDGKGLIAWLMIHMEITEMSDAQYTSYLMGGHETLFTIVNFHMDMARVGSFRRYAAPSNRFDEKRDASDFLFACYLSEKIGASWMDYDIDLSRWTFKYSPPEVDFQQQSKDPWVVKPWIPTAWVGPLIKFNRGTTNDRDPLMPNCNPQ